MSFDTPLYLDENATAQPCKEALRATQDWLGGPPGNASSAHALGRRARGVIERARRSVAQSLGVNSRHLTFCSGATEALHMVILGHLNRGDHVIVSALEHPAVWGALTLARQFLDIEVSIVQPNSKGELSTLDFVNQLRRNTALVIAMAAQNELGITYPIQEIAEAVGKIPILSDCVQAWGKLPLILEETGATFATLSGHKIGAPIGVGVVWCRDGAPLNPFLQGGSQERGRRAGTEPVALIAGIGVAAEHIKTRMNQMEQVRSIRDRLAEILCAHPKICLNAGTLSSRPWVDWKSHAELPNTLSLRIEGMAGDFVLQALDLAGYCLSSGSACSSGALSASPVLLALGLNEQEARSGLRISLSPEITEVSLEGFIKELLKLVEEQGI